MTKVIGRVTDVTSSGGVRAFIDSKHLEDIEGSVTVGTMVEIKSRAARVMGIVNAVHSPDGKAGSGAVITLDLVGEFSPGAKVEFSRGVGHWPGVGAEIYTISNADVHAVLELKSRGAVRIGETNIGATQEVQVDVDGLLRSHFAIFGATGSGKTSSTAVILRAILGRLPHAHVILLDPHNEYDGAFGELVERLTLATLRLPYWMLNFHELCAVFKILPENQYPSEIKILREAVAQAKTMYTPDKKPGTMNISADNPIPYRLSDLRRIVNETMGKLDNPDAIKSYLRILNRLDELTTDDRYTFMFGPQFVRDQMTEVICQLVRIPVSGKPMTTIDLSDIPEEIVDVVVAVVFRIVFYFAVWAGEDSAVPTLIICEEAHRYLWDDRSGETIRLAMGAASQVAKEGRKYGVSIGIISQRPSEVSPSIVSQCGTMISLRLSNERDLRFVSNALPDSAASLVGALKSLNNREAVIFGQGVAFPTRVMIDQLPASAQPKSKAKSFYDSWSTDHSHPEAVAGTVERWRKRTHEKR